MGILRLNNKMISEPLVNVMVFCGILFLKKCLPLKVC